MHLPVTVRRRVFYVAAAAVLVSGIGTAARPGALTTLKPAEPATSALPGATDAQETLEAPQGPAPAAQAEAAPEAKEEAARPKVSTYSVAEGDTIEAIAARFELKTETILWANDLGSEEILQVGQELKIPSIDGVVHTVQSGDTLWGIADEFESDVSDIVAANPDVNADALQPGELLVVPGGKPVVKRLSAMVASRGVERQAAASGSFGRWPVSGMISDWFGWRVHPVYGTEHLHDGMDIAVPIGTPVAAVAGGRVTYAGYLGGYGVTVKVDHGNGLVTMYAHMSEAWVEPGQQIGGGETVGLSGNTGASTGPHLHFTVFVGGSPVDPSGWLP